MTKILKKIIKHPLFSGSAVMVVGSNLTNLFAYIYHVIIGRLMGPVPYGELAAVLGIITLITATYGFLGLVVVKFVASAKETEYKKIFSWFGGKIFWLGITGSALLLVFSATLSTFIHADIWTILLLPVIFFISTITFLYRSFLQGLLKFKEHVFSTNIDMGGRLLFSVIFVYLGFSVFGAILGSLLAAMLSALFLSKVMKGYKFLEKTREFHIGKRVLKYAIPVSISSVATFSLFSTDLVLVKHFFEPVDAGLYAALSTLGKVIFFATAPVANVMFPLISKRHAKGENYQKVFLASLAMILGVSLFISAIYWQFPELMINLLYGEKFISASGSLVLFAIFMTVFALATTIANYYLSVEKYFPAYLMALAALTQVVGIWFIHSSVVSVISVSITVATFLLVGLLVYFAYDSAKRR